MLTTLLEPTEGRIIINGHDLAHNAYPVKRRMGLVPEESNVYTELTAWDNLMFTTQLYRVPRSERATRARELLDTFGLWEKRGVKVEHFSKGMRRRLSIAMAIIHKPTLLFLDEPTPGLDAQSARAIRNLIRQLNAAGTTIFLTTHQIEEANQLCDRVTILKGERKVENKTFDKWLAGLDLSFWGTAQHKVTAAQFFERRQNEGAVLLDVRSAEEATQIALPFALHIPIQELPDRWQEVPADRPAAVFCSAGTRAAIAYAYLQLCGRSNVRIFAGGYHELVEELKTGQVYRRLTD